MHLKESNSGLLCNFEVMDLLRSRGADQEDLTSLGLVTPSEFKVYDYLSRTPAGTQTHESLQKYFKDIEQYNMTKAERLQTANLRPSTAVEIHLIIEDCEERVDAEAIERLLQTIDSLPEPPEKPEGERDEEAGDAEEKAKDAEETGVEVEEDGEGGVNEDVKMDE